MVEFRKNNINANTNPCSSCGICVIACPHEAIAFAHDRDGFYKPTVNESVCTDCGICSKVCYKYLDEKSPFENTFNNKSIYAAWSKDKSTIDTSSSGGVGYELTQYCFDAGYTVSGVIFDATNNICKHIIVKSKDDIEAIKTSKYLQSSTIEAFSQLKKKEKYIIIATPCQIYGLRQWIQLKKRDNNDFILVDFFCHGTPSFNLWKKYKEYVCEKFHLDQKWESVHFRKKSPESKWHSYAISIQDSSNKTFIKSQALSEDLFFKFYLNNSCLNKSCYNCKLRLDYCASDIRIADFWGPKYEANDDGVSLVIINTLKGESAWKNIKNKLVVEQCCYEDLKISQPTRYLSPSPKWSIIMEELNGKRSLDKIYKKYFERSTIQRGLSYVKKKLLN